VDISGGLSHPSGILVRMFEMVEHRGIAALARCGGRPRRGGWCDVAAAGRLAQPGARSVGVARESAPAYRAGPAPGAVRDTVDHAAGGSPADGPADGSRVGGSPAGGPPVDARPGGECITAGDRGRHAVAELSRGPLRTPLGAAVELLADAVEALAQVDLAAEHDGDLGTAGLALHHLRARLDAALVGVLGAFDRREGYRADGAVTCGSWLRWRANVDHAAATALLQAARRLGDLDQLSDLLAAGDITLAHATAVTRAAVPQRAAAVARAEPVLAELARTNPPQDVRRALRHLADINDADGSDPPPADEQPPGDALRELNLRIGFEGRGALEATLDPLTREALTVLLDAFDTPDPADTPPAARRSAAQRRHDAFAAALHTLLAQPSLPSVQGARPQVLLTIDLAALLGLPADHPAAGTTLAEVARLLDIDPAELGLSPGDEPNTHRAGATGAPDAGGHGHRPAMPVHPPTPPRAAAFAVGPAAGRTDRRGARFGSGIEADPVMVLGLLPSAVLMAVLTLGPWRVVNVGAKHRTLPAWLRAVLGALHRHCRGPDCDRPAAWTQAHHIAPWVERRTTDLNDSLPLCTAHHDLITTKGWNATLDHSTGVVTWTSSAGRSIAVPAPEP
jgi:hypothetical protein